MDGTQHEQNPPENFTIVVIDAHRPFNLENVYQKDAVILAIFGYTSKFFSLLHCQIYLIDEDYDPDTTYPFPHTTNNCHESDSDHELKCDMNELPKLVEQLKRIKLTSEEMKEESDLDAYYHYTHYARPASTTMFQIAAQLDKDDLEMLWCGMFF